MRNKKITFGVLIILCVVLMIQVVFLLNLVSSIQGNARVVNYTGIVRGATQRLVKNELNDKKDDLEIARLDDILQGLQNGTGNQNITPLADQVYQQDLALLISCWQDLKQDIYNYRNDPTTMDVLYKSSEDYFVLADKTVSDAEKYSDGAAKGLNILEIGITVNIIFLLAVLSCELIIEIKSNKKLSEIAYVDIQTGLPNKRGCDNMLSSDRLISENENVCCIMFDLNNLKKTNDNLGHEVGDALISCFASILRRNMPGEMFVGRFGGDEFIGIQKDANKDEILKAIQNLIDDVLSTNDGNDNGVKISFAYGMAFSTDYQGFTIKTLMNVADKNMYENKNSLKNKKDLEN